ncbi:MAG: RcpC/CpaB family pilus assembly protein, partial [Acidimicrobiales bacterium]
GVGGVAAQLPPGLRALAVPVDAASLPLRQGYRVDVLATFDTADPAAEPTFPVATAALVLDVAEDAVTLAVTPTEAPRLAFAIARGTIALALTSSEARSEGGRIPAATPTSSAPRP